MDPTPRTRPRTAPRPSAAAFEALAAVEIDAVTPSEHGFTLTGQGSDGVDYRLDLRFDVRLDPRTRTVLGELLSQSDLTISRRAQRNS
jgi:hypothetical protein